MGEYVIEGIQWGLILFLAVLTLGLTRQLGLLMIPRREMLRLQGPVEGRRLPSFLISETAGELIRDAIRGSGAKLALIVVVDETCPICAELIDAQSRGVFDDLDLPFVALVRASRPEFVRHLEDAVSIIVQDRDGSGCERANIAATPFLMLVDDEIVLQRSDVGGDVRRFVEQWRSDNRPDSAQPSDVTHTHVHDCEEVQAK
jgi:hypothetical protein